MATPRISRQLIAKAKIFVSCRKTHTSRPDTRCAKRYHLPLDFQEKIVIDIMSISCFTIALASQLSQLILPVVIVYRFANTELWIFMCWQVNLKEILLHSYVGR